MIEAYHIDTSALRLNPAHEGALDDRGHIQILPTAFWQQFNQAEIGAFCVRQGLYCIPTVELVEWLRDRIGGRNAIEIGSGNGVMAAALDIPATDNKMQEWPDIKAHYDAIKQTPVPYGKHVKEMDARSAINFFRPEVVVAAWVTHKWNERESWREGNKYGVDEGRIIQRKTYIHIGNRYVHRFKPILDVAHEEHEFPWLVSRAMNGEPNFIAVWGK